MKLVEKVRVKNAMGIHTRPAATIVKILQSIKSDVFFTHRKEKVNAKSILSLLMLAAQKNAQITIEIEGEDAHTAMDRLLEGFNSKFGE